MSKRVVQHEIKLQKSVIVILMLLVIGLFANAHGPGLGMKDAMAEYLSGDIRINHNLSGAITVY